MERDFFPQNPKVENPVKTTCPILFGSGLASGRCSVETRECHVKEKNALGLGPFLYGAVKCDNNDNYIT